MFGWEFPPHILGGLGTASYGLTKGMAENGNMDITFVIPKPWGDQPKEYAKIIGANCTPIAWRRQLGLCEEPHRQYNGPAVVL